MNWRAALIIVFLLGLRSPSLVLGADDSLRDQLIARSQRSGWALAMLSEQEVAYYTFGPRGIGLTRVIKWSDSTGAIVAQNGERFLGSRARHAVVLDLKGRVVSESGRRFEFDSQLSHDGRMIAFQNLAGLFVTSLQSGETRQLVAENQEYHSTLAWSPDSMNIVFSRDREVKIYHLQTSTIDALGPGWDPTWSPDGNTIAFREPGSAWFGRGVLIDARTHRESTLPHLGEIVGAIRWSPDSRYVVYADLKANILSQLLAFASMAQVNGRMVVRRVADGAEWTLLDGGESGLPQHSQWVVLPPDLR